MLHLRSMAKQNLSPEKEMFKRNCKTQGKLNTSNSNKYGFVGDLEDGTGPKLEPNTEGIVGTILSLCVIHRRTQAQRCQELEVL